MTGRSFGVKLMWSTTGGIAVPRLEFPVLVSRGSSQFESVTFQWDSGADFSVMSTDHARRLGVDLSHEPDAEVRGVTGPSAAWLVRRWVRFPGIDGYQFKLKFLVPVGSGEDRPLRPLLGLLDTYENFEVRSLDQVYFFQLADRHKGEALPADDDRPS